MYYIVENERDDIVKNYFEEILKIYNSKVIEKPSTMKNGKIQMMRRFENYDVVTNLYSLTENIFDKINKEFVDVKIKFKYGQFYNLATSPWIQLYYLEKNSKGKNGNYCGISIDRKNKTISLWIGFGKTDLSKNEINVRKNEQISLYKKLFGNKLNRDFKFETVFVDAVIISKTYLIDKINDDEFLDDIRYLLGIYMDVEDYKLNSIVDTDKVSFDNNSVNDDYPVDGCINGVNIIYRGYPGGGKSFEIDRKYLRDMNGELIDERCYERIVFYAEYTNADFVGSIRPMIRNHHACYEFVPGPFTLILKRAIEHPKTNFYLIIEELNRGRVESIFGDILLLLDRDDDGRSVYSITNNCIAEYVFGNENKKIFIPSNLSIIATMNVSDENVQTLDTAFERRWDNEWILGDVGVFDNKYIKGMNDITWGKFRNIINEQIVSQRGLMHNEDKQLGPYFISKNLLSDNFTNDVNDRKVFMYKVILYLYDNVCKYNKKIIFDDKINSINMLINLFMTNEFLNVFNEKIRDELCKK